MIAGEILLDTRANRRIFQALEQFLDSAIGGPGRKRGGKRRGAGGVRIHVRCDVQAGVACDLDGRDYVLHAAPAGLAADFQVENLDRQIGFAADADGFGEGGHLRGAFAPHMRGVEAAVF